MRVLKKVWYVDKQKGDLAFAHATDYEHISEKKFTSYKDAVDYIVQTAPLGTQKITEHYFSDFPIKYIIRQVEEIVEEEE